MMEHFRLGSLVLVEEIIKTLCVQTPIIVQDMCILLCDHRSLCMVGVTLNGFDITAAQLEFVCSTGVSEAMKDHFGEIVFLNQPLQCTVDGRLLSWHSQWTGNYKIVVRIFCTQCFLCHILLCFEFNEHFSNCFGEEDGSDTAVCFGAFQNLNRGTAGTQ